ncbi:hypothetical protein CMI45_00070 [Candidatus Pacearchaeota archaeon]|nr:hypothetical protein [Candidatus Pacearchaeota archaeon]|tara:strand:- start:995 stop:1342 length:348 start_codon:yes stop_codon:yes gene_type:complete
MIAVRNSISADYEKRPIHPDVTKTLNKMAEYRRRHGRGEISEAGFMARFIRDAAIPFGHADRFLFTMAFRRDNGSNSRRTNLLHKFGGIGTLSMKYLIDYPLAGFLIYQTYQLFT